MIQLKIHKNILAEVLNELRTSSRKERVVLLLGNRNSECYIADEMFVPMQITDRDYFEIPEEGMDELMNKLRSDRKMMVAQIHTHPGTAFHSQADDKWAIIRHKNAYSLVLPHFASTTTLSNFFERVATYTLNEKNIWTQASNSNLELYE